MISLNRCHVVLALSFGRCPAFIARAKTIVGCFGSATNQFPNLSPPLATLNAELSDLETAQQSVVDKVPGATAARNAKAAVLLTSLQNARTYVQGLCDASPEQATTLVAAAGMKVQKRSPVQKPELAASLTTTPGNVKLVANRSVLVGVTSAATCFSWQYSVDGGKTWVSAPSTVKASTLVTGLPLLAPVAFRVMAENARTTSAWSQAVTMVVH